MLQDVRETEGIPLGSLIKGHLGVPPNSVPMVLIVFSRHSWGLESIDTHVI